jgi:hypothetical protein
MIKGLNVVSLFLALGSVAVGSLGVLTPDAVHNLGHRLANYTLSKPDSFVLKAAYYKAEKPEYPNKDPKQWLNRCLIDFVVSLITMAIATFMTFMTFFLLLGLSLWGLVRAWTQPGPHPFEWGLSVVGLLICISAACSFMSLKPKDNPTTLDKLVQKAVRINERLLMVTVMPFIWLFTQLVSVFTMTLPLWWYQSLKAIHSRGVNWLFALIGLLMFSSSCALQLSAILMAP